MKHVLFGEDVTTVKTAVLIKTLNKNEIINHYLKDMDDDINTFVAFNLHYVNNKVTAKDAREYLAELLEGMDGLGITTLYVADSTYFKYLTGVKKVSDMYNEVVPCDIKDYRHIKCILGVNYQAGIYDPKMIPKMQGTVETLKKHLAGSFTRKTLEPKTAILQEYEDSIALNNMLNTFVRARKVLAVDIETTGLRFNEARIESIAFAYSDSEGYAAIIDGKSGSLKILKKFFKAFDGKLIYHNGLFDIKFLIYHCFMEDKNDLKGMLEGIQVMTKHVDDTMIMTYLCTNNTQGNELGLKPNTVEYTGNYAEDVKDITKLSYNDLLMYNLRDTLATFWLYNKRKIELATEGQVEIYNNVFMPSLPVLLEMMLVGLPMDMSRLDVVTRMLQSEVRQNKKTILSNDYVKSAVFKIAIAESTKANAKLKKKLKSITDFVQPFNINSNTQKAVLFYDVMGLPIIETTDSGLPSCSGKTIKKLAKQIDDEKTKQLLEAFKDYMDADKILTTFIKAFTNFAFEKNGLHWLNGNHKLGGTLSGRLSSTEPNLANLPSNSKYGKDIKSIFKAPEGWLFAGSDFSALNI